MLRRSLPILFAAFNRNSHKANIESLRDFLKETRALEESASMMRINMLERALPGNELSLPSIEGMVDSSESTEYKMRNFLNALDVINCESSSYGVSFGALEQAVLQASKGRPSLEVYVEDIVSSRTLFMRIVEKGRQHHNAVIQSAESLIGQRVSWAVRMQLMMYISSAKAHESEDEDAGFIQNHWQLPIDAYELFLVHSLAEISIDVNRAFEHQLESEKSARVLARTLFTKIQVFIDAVVLNDL